LPVLLILGGCKIEAKDKKNLLIYCSITPIIRINWDREPSGYAENPDNWIFSFKIGNIGDLKWETFSTSGYF
jgi:hypothetical protein